MAFFNFEINTIEEAKIAKAMLDTFISMNESKKGIVVEPKKEVVTKVEDEIKTVAKPITSKKEVVTKVEDEIKTVAKPITFKKEVKFKDIQLLCKSAVNACSNKKEEREVRTYISELASSFGSSKGIRDIDISNYTNFYNKLYEYMGEKPF